MVAIYQAIISKKKILNKKKISINISLKFVPKYPINNIGSDNG